jgi:hypothetical protein
VLHACMHAWKEMGLELYHRLCRAPHSLTAHRQDSLTIQPYYSAVLGSKPHQEFCGRPCAPGEPRHLHPFQTCFALTPFVS